LFRSRYRPRLVYERPVARLRSGQRQHALPFALDLRIPASIIVGVMLFVGLLGDSGQRTCQVARIAGCYDGDTCKAFIAGREERVRLVGFDTPELAPRARCAEEHRLGIDARNRLNGMIRSSSDPKFCRSQPDFTRDDYGRILAVLVVDGRDVAPIMIDEGLAVPFPLGRRPDWCG